MKIYQFNGKDIDYEREITLDDYVDLIKGDDFKESVLELRGIDKKSDRDGYKDFKHDKLPLFYFYGEIKYELIERNKMMILKRSGLINPLKDFNIQYNKLIGERWPIKHGENNLLVLDIDGIDVDEYFEIIKGIPWVHMCHVTSSGRGFRVIVKSSGSFRQKMNQTQRELRTKYGIRIDDELNDNTQLFYSGWDPNIYYNKDSVQL